MDAKISFCITVYNQLNIVKECIDSIVQYLGEDIEVIVSDDRSTDDIEGLVNSYKDNRIKYFCNDTNVGHDRNILNALEHATGKYAFLLRSRDKIIPEAIPLLLTAAEEDGVSYITGAAINQKGENKITYSKERYAKGIETIEANYKLYIHPSGSMYNLQYVDLQELKAFVEEIQLPRWGFVVHNFIRLKLALAGDFLLIQEPVWIYADTENAKDVAVNRGPNGASVYDPSFIEERYKFDISWAERILQKDIYYTVFKRITALYLDLITWGFKLTNSDKRVQSHYDFKKQKFSVLKARKSFRSVCSSYYSEKMGVNKEQFTSDINRIFTRNITLDAAKYGFRKITNGTPLYNFLNNIYKKYIKRL